MQKQGKSRKGLIIGIVAAVAILAAVLVLLLTQCTGGETATTTAPSTTTASEEVPTYELYWNADRAEYDGKSEAGMSSRSPEADGYFHVRFILDGEEVTLKVQDRKLINKIDVMDLMGLVFDENGTVCDVLDIKEMPLERVAWQFYVQSAGGKLIKANSSDSFGGMEVQLEGNENTGVYDMTGKSGPIGCEDTPIEYDRIYAIKNLAGELTHVFIYERINYMLTHEAECQHCKKTVTWYEWAREDKLPTTSGHYQLQNDIVLDKQQSMSQQDQKICLDLNGKRVDGKSGARIYSLHNAGSHLAIMDTSEGQTGVLAAHGTANAQGMVVWVRYGQFHLYSGTLDGSDATTKYYGTTVTVPKNAYFYMYGGTIIGGTATYVKNAETGAYSRGYGGTMYVGGKFVMHDGEIRDGFAQSVTYRKAGATSTTTSRGYGGNIFVGGTGELELNGGVIKDGKAGSSGGNIYVDGSSTVTLNGTQILYGKATGKGKNGGSIYIGSKGTFNMNGGCISGGLCYNAGGNVYSNGLFVMNGGYIKGGRCYNFTTRKVNENSTNFNLFVVNGKFKMYGGRIYGGVGVTDTSETKTTYVSLSGNPVIKSDVEGRTNLTLNTGGEIQVKAGNLRDKAEIGVYTARGVFTMPTKEENKDKFFSDVPEAEIIYTEEGLALGRMKCVCGKTETHINGCDGTVYLWSPWISGTSLPKTTGNYFLIKDVVTTGQYVIGKGETVRFDMNGHDVTYDVSPLSSDGFRVYRSAFESLMVITDTTDNPGTMRSEMASEAEVLAAVQAKLDAGTYDQAKADKIIAAQKGGNFGQVLWARGGDIILHNGIIDGSNLNGTKSGMTVYVAANTASEDGGVTRKGSFTMYGGVIKGATSTSYGCSLYGSSNSVIKIHGGEIVGGTSTGNGGGNAYVFGEFYMDGGVIRDGKAYSSGGNLVVEGAKAVATITGTAQILNGEAGDPTLEKDIGRGGNIRVVTKGAQLILSGDAVVSGGKVYRSASNKGGYGGNISVNTDTTMTMTGGTVEGGVSTYRAGNIDVCGVLNVEGGTITGGKARYGGNIYVLNGTGRELNISGGLIEKGHATYSGGNIYTLGTTNITGGEIAEGKALLDSGKPSTSNGGGNIHVCNELNISGDAIIRDGYTAAYGGNINMSTEDGLYANVTISGNAQVLRGVVDGQGVNQFDGGYGGNIRAASSTTLTVKDNVLISGGQAIGGKYDSTAKKGGGGQGGSLYMTSATVNLLGGVLEDGTASGGGGNIGINGTSGVLVMDGVIVRNGDTGSNSGGNIRIRTAGIELLEIKGDTQILNGKAAEGGNIHISSNEPVVMTMSDKATIAGGNVPTTGNGANVWINANVDFTMSGDSVIDATGCVGKRGSAIYMGGASVFTMEDNAQLIGSKDASVTHGAAAYLRNEATIGGNAMIIAGDGTTYGNAIYFHSGKLTVKDNAIIDAAGTTAEYGAAIYCYSSSGNLALKDNAQILGGSATTSGAAIQASCNVDISGDVFILGGEAATSGGAIYVTGDMTMSGGTIVGGDAKYGGSVYVYSGGTFTMSDGTIVGGRAHRGGNVVVESNASAAKFTMTGGIISGGEAYLIDTANGQGGNIWLYNNKTAKSTVVIDGGNIGGKVTVDGTEYSGGYSSGNGGNFYIAGNTTVTLKNAQVMDGVAGVGSGGNIYNTGSVVMEKTTVTGGINGIEYTASSSKPNGGSIYISNSAELTMTDCTVTGGRTINTGGNFVVYGDLIMNGGTVSGGAKINNAGEVTSTVASNANVYLVSGNLTMNGGTIDGRLALYGDSFLNITGDVNLHTEDEVDGDLFLNGTTEPITITGSLGEERLIAVIRLNDCENVFSGATEKGNEKYFDSVDESLSVFMNADSKLEIGKVMCICGFKNGKHIGDCDGTEYNWSEWKDTEYLPTTTGYYYLAADLQTKGTTAVKSTNQKIALDLNGHTIYGTDTGSRIFGTYYDGTYYSGTELTLVNSGDTGMIQGWKKDGNGKIKSENGGILWAASKNTTFNLYNIILDASKNKPADGVVKNGMAVMLSGTGSKLNVFSSTVMGGDSPKGDAIALHSGKYDQKVRLEGDVTIIGTNGSSLFMGGEGCTVDVSKLESLNAPISVEATGVFTTGWNESWKVEDYFVSGTEDGAIVVEGGELAMRPYHCICDMPDGKHVEGFCDGTKFVWSPWSKSVMPSAGNWYLTSDITATDFRIAAANNTVIRVDMNGFDFTSGENRIITTYSSKQATDNKVDLVLTNTNSEDRSVVTITGSGDQGRGVWLRGENKSLKVYNMDFVAADGATGGNGVFFSVQPQSGTNKTGNHLELYNVTMTGATSTASTGAGALCGGNYTDIVLKDVTITGCSGTQGGAIRMVGSSTLTMENVTIDGSECSGLGAAIYATGTCAVSMKDVSITNATGTEDNGIYLNDHATLTMTGTVVADVYRNADTKLDVSDLADGSKIVITGVAGVISANDYEADDADLTYLSAGNDEQYIAIRDGKINLLGKECMCGMPEGKHVSGFCDKELRSWKPWEGTVTPSESGNYFLTGDVTITSGADLSKKDAEIVIDLNGFDLTLPSRNGGASRLFTTYTSAGSTSNVSIAFTNRSSDASTIKVEGAGNEGRIMWLTGTNKKMSMYNVDIDMSKASTYDSARMDGIAISVGGTGNDVKIYDSNITGGTVASQGGVLYVRFGSTATLTRCTVEGGNAKVGAAGTGGYGGFAYVRGTLTLNDCTIKNCSAEMGAGAIYLYGENADNHAKLIMNGGSIEGCVANGDKGGAIDLQSNADAELEDVTIKNCSATWGGAIQVRVGNTLEMTDCDIIGCSSTKGAGAIYLYSDTEGSPAKLIMNDCTIDGCTTSGYGGGIVAGYYSGSNPATYTYAELNNTTIKNCSAKGRAGALHISNGSEAVLNGCTIEKNTDTSRAGGIYSYKGTLTLIDTEVKDNTTTGSSSKGAGIYLYGVDITLGGTVVIDGNTSAGSASNLFLNGNKVVLAEDKPLKSGSSIGLDCGAVTVSNDVTYADKAYFHTDKTAYQVVHDGALKVVSSSGHWHCVCGGQPTGDPNHECVDIEFTAIDALAGGSKLATGNYYLTDDVTVSGTSNVGFAADAEVNFCLAGHTLTGHNADRVFFAGSSTPVTFTLTSCGEDATKGTIKNASQKESNILGFYHTSSVFNMYNVTLDASEAAYTAKSWGTVINSKSTFNMYSGTIIGSKSSDNLAATGNVSVGSGSVMNMYGGTITGGICSSTYATAGNVYVAGTLNMMGGTITGGSFGDNATHRSANMYVNANGTLNMMGGTITGHVFAGTAGATVKISGKANIYDSDRSLWIVPGNTNLFIGKMASGAKVHMNVLTEGNNYTTGVIASGLNDYKLTEADLACFLVTKTDGTQNRNLVLNDDNTVSAVEMN